MVVEVRRLGKFEEETRGLKITKNLLEEAGPGPCAMAVGRAESYEPRSGSIRCS